MRLNIAVCNVDWMMRLFDTQGNLKTDTESQKRAQAPATVVAAIDPDIPDIGLWRG
jgi:hypothetical protein